MTVKALVYGVKLSLFHEC